MDNRGVVTPTRNVIAEAISLIEACVWYLLWVETHLLPRVTARKVNFVCTGLDGSFRYVLRIMYESPS